MSNAWVEFYKSLLVNDNYFTSASFSLLSIVIMANTVDSIMQGNSSSMTISVSVNRQLKTDLCISSNAIIL